MSQKRDGQRLQSEVERELNRIKKAERERKTIMAQTVYLGTLGLIFVLPVIAGAYLGSWLDQRLTGYSFSWTVSLIVIGVFIGAVDVYLFVREPR
jgi:ATP synthase protein I